MKKRIIFAGEDPALKRELHDHFQGADGEWEMSFARNGAEALATIGQTPCDAVVADVQLPGGGAQLLDEVMKRQPKAIRFILGEFSSSTATMKCIGTAHQFLLKPTDAQTVRNALERAFALETWLPGETAQRLLAGVRKLPSPPNLYFQVVKELQSPDASLERTGDLVAQDPMMSAKLLQLVNSAVFGLQLQVGHPAEAVMYLGAETTKSLILLAHTFSYFDEVKAAGFSIDQLWRHSLQSAKFAQWIAELESDDPNIESQSFTAGVVHDLGKLILAANLPEKFGDALALARQQGLQLWEAERDLFGTTHAEIGACLLGIWGLPMPIVEAVALHHHPAQFLSQTFSPLAAVHAANVLEHQANIDNHGLRFGGMDEAYLAGLGVGGRLESWQKHCTEKSSRDKA
ncbi:MAG: HDOD domain-containing protein [Verrucomicrobia bacterium]|nr:HDOD domain-containing protein [Verrucomicrobiota bacterium]